MDQRLPARGGCQRFGAGALGVAAWLACLSAGAVSAGTAIAGTVGVGTAATGMAIAAAPAPSTTAVENGKQPAAVQKASMPEDAPSPYYSDAVFVMALAEHHHLPLAQRFREQSLALQEAARALCPVGQTLPVVSTQAAAAASPSMKATRSAWLLAANTWAQLDAVSVGPVITRRSAKAIDFRPTRPRLILKVLAALDKTDAVPDAAAMGKIGSATKGMAAIEWLLWSPQAPATEAACRYLRGMVDDVAREAQALAHDYQADAAVDWVAASEDDGQPVAVEGTESAAQRAAMIVNQWLGGLEGLRWRALGKPLAVIETASGDKATDPHRDIWPRPPSASHRQAWQARWASLKQVGIGRSPTDGSGPQPERLPAVVSLEALLRGLGKAAVADTWRRAVIEADDAITALVMPLDDTRLPSVKTMKEALAALDRLKWLMQDKVAPALSVTLGFSDADGD
ncbi:MAG: imelysin family protein [Lautropia sp.]|nr:imelysin family protein [Lautropia sp.]